MNATWMTASLRDEHLAWRAQALAQSWARCRQRDDSRAQHRRGDRVSLASSTAFSLSLWLIQTRIDWLPCRTPRQV